jgi:hypothetical protein
MCKLFALAFLLVTVLALDAAQAGDDSRWPTCKDWQAMPDYEKRIYTIAYANAAVAAAVYADSVDRSANVARLLYKKAVAIESANVMEARLNTACQEDPGGDVLMMSGRIVFGLGNSCAGRHDASNARHSFTRES